MPETVLNPALRYHERTKHYYHHFAASAGYLDWDNQPNPFRFYEGVLPQALSLEVPDPDAAYPDLYERARNLTRSFSPENISLFLALSLGLSAWKSIGDTKWALRMNPSSGNLHPTESYLILPKREGSSLESGLYHYNSYLHALERRTVLPLKLSETLGDFLSSGGFLFALTSIYWREAWKYGERAFRYSHHDIGHALAAASFAANLLGWKVSYLNEVSDEEIGSLLGFPKTQWVEDEKEYPEMLCAVYPAGEPQASVLSLDLIRQLSELSFEGRPNRLSQDHADWNIIPETAQAILKPRTVPEVIHYPQPAVLGEEKGTEQAVSLKAAQIIRQRRSLLACDGVTAISKAVFFAMLNKTLPRENTAPFDFKLGPARVHLFIFVHRVNGVIPGLYAFIRNPEALEPLKSACHSDFLWKTVQEGFGLYLLREGALNTEATSVSCTQSIAGDGAFSLGMVATFMDTVTRAPYFYRHLFWETGMIGQVLYLEAEAHGVRATGIGCFFDEPFHEILGLKDQTFQSLYHFTVGGPVEDTRLQVWPPYFHLKEEGRKK